jgi:hypothetical protein
VDKVQATNTYIILAIPFINDALMQLCLFHAKQTPNFYINIDSYSLHHLTSQSVFIQCRRIFLSFGVVWLRPLLYYSGENWLHKKAYLLELEPNETGEKPESTEAEVDF